MSDNLWGERFGERKGDQRAWHLLGTVKDGGWSDASTALTDIDADYDVITAPHWYRNGNGELVESNTVEILRPAWNGEPEVSFGSATKEFTPIQNRDICRLLDPFTSEWPVETIGVIRDGRDLFVTLDAGTSDIGGDEVRRYFFVWNGHDASHALKVRLTPVRVVCNNTCITGDRQAFMSIDVRHTRRVMTEAEWAFNNMAMMRKALDRNTEALTKLTTFRLDRVQVSEIFKAVYPVRDADPVIARLESIQDTLTDVEKANLHAMKSRLEAGRVAALQSQLKATELFIQFNAEFPRMAATGWAVYNAITQFECWKDGNKGQSEKAIGMSILSGERHDAMARGYDQIIKVAVGAR